MRVGSTLEDATLGAELVIEAIFEDIEAKRTVFAELDSLGPAVLPAHGACRPLPV